VLFRLVPIIYCPAKWKRSKMMTEERKESEEESKEAEKSREANKSKKPKKRKWLGKRKRAAKRKKAEEIKKPAEAAPVKPDERWQERQDMVKYQLAGEGIFDKEVLKSMGEVPRHRFVPEDVQVLAYDAIPLPINDGQTISQPIVVAMMTQALELKKEDKVLEIGTGSGYAAAVLSRIVDKVYTMERFSDLAQAAQALYRELHYDNIEVKVGDGTKGWPEEAPFDAIVVTAAAPDVPKSLLAQLAPGGRLVIPVGTMWSQELVRVRCRQAGDYKWEVLEAVRFVPLIGEEGWPED
jgi:protein-L-isoaspartate(D-aspartate) O-methyltransferase